MGHREQFLESHVLGSFPRVHLENSHAPKALVALWGAVVAVSAEPARPSFSPTNILAPVSVPAQSIFDLSLFVLLVTAAIFIVVFSLLAVVKFRKRRANEGREPAKESRSLSRKGSLDGVLAVFAFACLALCAS